MFTAAECWAQLRPGDAFLLGTDLVKDPAVLVAAYDDSAGVTAAFNNDVMSVLNAGLGADFPTSTAFEHVAAWDAGREWIEMRLRAASAQSVRVRDLGLTVEFAVNRGRCTHRGVGQVPAGRGRRGAGRRGAGDAVVVDGSRRPVRPVAGGSRIARPPAAVRRQRSDMARVIRKPHSFGIIASAPQAGVTIPRYGGGGWRWHKRAGGELSVPHIFLMSG